MLCNTVYSKQILFYDVITNENDKILVNILTYDLTSIWKSIFVLLMFTIPFSFSIKKQIRMPLMPYISVAYF